MSSQLSATLEALILASDEPLTLVRLREVTGESANTLLSALDVLMMHYQSRGIQLCSVADGWQFRTHQDQSDVVAQLWENKAPRLSRAMLETLAIIVYQQPVTRAEIESIRGISVSSSIIGNLLERGWVRIVGRKDVPGRPHIYASAKQFLLDFNLDRLTDLPDAAQLLDEDIMNQLLEARRHARNRQHGEKE